MKKYIVITLFALLFSGLHAKKYQPAAAFGLSVLLPGAGCYYTGEKGRGRFYLATEALIWFSYLRLDSEADRMNKSNKIYATSNSGAASGQNKYYYQSIAGYDSSDDLNLEIERWARNRYIIYEYKPEEYQKYLDENKVPEELAWNWNSSVNRSRYMTKRKNAQDMESYTKLAFGSLFINRIISAIDSARLARNKNRLFNSENKSLSVVPNFNKNGLMVNYEVHF